MSERSASRNLTTCQELNPGRYTGGGLLCGRPAKDGICASHAAGRKRAEAHQEKLAAKERHAHALAAARDEVVRAAVALAPDIAAEHPDASGYRVVNITERDAAAFCAAVAALARLEKP